MTEPTTTTDDDNTLGRRAFLALVGLVGLSGTAQAHHKPTHGTDDGLTTVASGTVTARSGATPAVKTTLDASVSETTPTVTAVQPASANQTTATYAYNADWGSVYDPTTGSRTAQLTINWDTDPGTDMTFEWTIAAL